VTSVGAGGPRRRILVVDDDVDAAEALGELLRDCGLAECLVSGPQFEDLFVGRIHHVLSKDSAFWQQARERLIVLAHPDKVLKAYLEACGLKENKPERRRW